MKLSELRAKKPIGFKLEAKPGKKSTKIYLYGDIVDEHPVDPWSGKKVDGEFITPDRVRDIVDNIDGDIELHLNSYGGSVFASIAIANYLRSCGNHIDVYVDAIGASGGSIIAMAGDTVKMYAGSMLMIHKAWGVAVGNSDDLRKQAETLDKVDLSVVANYAERFNGTADELLKMITDETWLTAEDAVNMGFADEIVKGKPEREADPVEEPEEEPTEEPVEEEQDKTENKINQNTLMSFVDTAFFNLKNRGK